MHFFQQFMATVANSMMFLGVGMMVAVPTVVIGVLHNSKGELSLDDRQSSWFGKLITRKYIFCNIFILIPEFTAGKCHSYRENERVVFELLVPEGQDYYNDIGRSK